MLVEWGDVVEMTFGEHLVVHLEHDDDPGESDDDPSEVRSIEIAGVGPSWASRWGRILEVVEEYRC